MWNFPFVKQLDSMQCGIACISMICRFYGRNVGISELEGICHATTEGVSMHGIVDAAHKLGLETFVALASMDKLSDINLPCILHWNQNHFVVLYKISKKGKSFHVADPGKGLVIYSADEFEKYWISSSSEGEGTGIVALLKPNSSFMSYEGLVPKESTSKHSFRFLIGYIRQYKKYFTQIILGLGIGCILQLLMPFLTQWIVDIGIKHKDIGFIWLVLLGELMIVVGRTATDFIRRWILLHISMRINISLVSDFFIKLLKLPMSFFDTKLMGDLLQRIGDHTRVQNFLTGQVLNIVPCPITLKY